MHKATPATWGGLFARFTSWEFSTCRSAYWTSLAIPQTILGCSALVGKSLSPARHWHWDGVDWLDPSRALVLATGRTTEDNPSKEMQGKHNANAHPVAENRSGEIANCQPVPQEQENPTLQAINAEHQTQAEQTDQDKHQATAILIHRN